MYDIREGYLPVVPWERAGRLYFIFLDVVCTIRVYSKPDS